MQPLINDQVNGIRKIEIRMLIQSLKCFSLQNLANPRNSEAVTRYPISKHKFFKTPESFLLFSPSDVTPTSLLEIEFIAPLEIPSSPLRKIPVSLRFHGELQR